MDTKNTTISGRQASSRFLSVELREQPRLLASVRLRMPSGLEADLPEGLAIEDIVRLLKGLFWDVTAALSLRHHVALIAPAIATPDPLPTSAQPSPYHGSRHHRSTPSDHMTLPETFCVYAIINHSRRELYYGLHNRDAAAAIIRGHEAGQAKETRHWFPCEPEEVELNILARGLSLEHAAAMEFQLLRMDLGELLKGYRVL